MNKYLKFIFRFRLNTCQKCIASDGGCCTNVSITIHRDEASKFLQVKVRNQLPSGHSFEEVPGFPDLYEYDSDEEACMFLGNDLQCSIYETRPSICRTYPVMWKKQMFRTRWFADTTCPLTSEVGFDEMRHWIDLLPQPHIIKEIGDLDIDLKDSDYIDIDRYLKKYPIIPVSST